MDGLSRLYDSSYRMDIERAGKIVIFSDLHMGDGSRNDDFVRNSELFLSVLKQYYRRGYSLILNGDVEELQRFPLKKIMNAWAFVYELFSAFDKEGRFFKITGNHDMDLAYEKSPFTVRESICLDFHGSNIFLLHGHQSSYYFSHFNGFSGFMLRHLANPLGIKNYSISHDNKTRFMTEKRFYDFSRDRRIITIIGHTHRPLFESLSKIDTLKLGIENLCNSYLRAHHAKKPEIRVKIMHYKAELVRMMRKNRGKNPGTLYTDALFTPCLFNSGCVIGKRGVTAIEIAGNKIRLVQWMGGGVKALTTAPVRRNVFKEDSLVSIFNRINLLC